MPLLGILANMGGAREVSCETKKEEMYDIDCQNKKPMRMMLDCGWRAGEEHCTYVVTHRRFNRP